MAEVVEPAKGRRPRVVIIGGGFAGFRAARTLRSAPADVLLLDRTNHHVFQPLLYQVATAVLPPSDITSPIRFLLRRQPNTTVLLSEVTGIDPDGRRVHTDDGRHYEYDYLIVASGARHAYFGRDDWEPFAPGLKSIEDAVEIRRRFLRAFEEAEKSDDLEERRALLTFVIVGAGPTGVELAGILPDIAHRSMRADFRRVDTRDAKVILLEGGPRVLPTFPESLSERAHRDLVELGVDVRTGARVTEIDADGVSVGDERIVSRTVFWAAGNAASPLAHSLGAPLDNAGRVLVEPDMSVPGRREVFVVGDLAAIRWDEDRWVPGVAPAANQGGQCAARNIARDLKRQPRERFRYRDKGNLATVGRHRAVADFGRFELAGALAWWFWLFVHILYLAGFRNRLSVLIEWGYSYITYRRGSRLITRSDIRYGVSAAPSPPPEAAPISPRW